MKKVFCLVLTLVLITGILQFAAVAEDEVVNLVPEGGNYEVTVYVDEDLPEDVQALIYAFFYGITPPESMQPDGLLCTLFGHNFTTSESTTVTHNVYTTSPKCVRNTYLTKTCTRCGYVETELTSSVRISTCHG